MPKKILIPLIIVIVVLAAGLGIFIASNQSVQPTATVTTEPPANELAITEIDRTITVPDDLGETTYQATDALHIVMYSEKYEALDGCAGRPIAEVQLSGTPTDDSVEVGGTYKHAVLVLQPMGPCGKTDGTALAGSFAQAFTDAR